jgi:hypothetical protein
MGFKPQTFGDSISNNFSEQIKPVSISIDNVADLPQDTFKVLLQIEPPEVLKNLKYSIIDAHKKYDLILAWDEDILSECKNSVCFPFGTAWISDFSPVQKQFAVSFLSSSKNSALGHQVRYGMFGKLPQKIGNVDVVKHMSPPFLPKKDELIKPFQYSIIIENCRRKNWFTEKLVDCFVSKTIPLYWGCPNIQEFFNPDGIVKFTTYEEIYNFLGNIGPDYYYSKMQAVEENYLKGIDYSNIWKRVDKIISERL